MSSPARPDGPDEPRSESEADARGSDDDFDRASSGFAEPGNGTYFIQHGRVYNNTSWAYRFPADQEEVLGIWLAEMAELFPHVDCVGVDLMNLQHSHHLRNCTYMCVEAPTGLDMFPNRSFDVVQLRQMAYSLADFPETLRQVHRILRPGGIVLIHEPQCQYYSSYERYTAVELAPVLCQWLELLRRAIIYRGIDLTAFDKMEDLLEAAGFDRAAINVFFHYRQIAPCDDTNDVALNETANSLSMVSAARLLVLEAGDVTADAYDEVERAVADELGGRGTGRAGPRGSAGVISPWGYWWVRKEA
ncbi:hypothetical protein Q5752_003692 [Cryptotrichosporon argae]